MSEKNEPIPLVSVIIPVLDQRPGIEFLIRALLDQTVPRDSFEVVIVDNGSCDGTPAILADYSRRYPGWLIFLQENSIQSSYAARNRALEAARGKIFAFTDGDCIPDARWIEEGLHALEECDYAAGRVELFPENEAQVRIAERFDMLTALKQYKYIKETHFGLTANLFVKRSVIEQVGRFDSRLKSSGDLCLGQRVYRAGFRQAYAPLALVRHPARQTVGAILSRMARIAGGIEQRRQYNGEKIIIGYLVKYVLIREYPTLKKMRELAGVDWRLGYVAFLVKVVFFAERIRLKFGGQPRYR